MERLEQVGEIQFEIISNPVNTSNKYREHLSTALVQTTIGILTLSIVELAIYIGV